jgi:hypothetical protein
MSVHHGRLWGGGLGSERRSLDTATTFIYAPINYLILIFTLVRKLLWPLRQLLLIRTSEWIEVYLTSVDLQYLR